MSVQPCPLHSSGNQCLFFLIFSLDTIWKIIFTVKAPPQQVGREGVIIGVITVITVTFFKKLSYRGTRVKIKSGIQPSVSQPFYTKNKAMIWYRNSDFCGKWQNWNFGYLILEHWGRCKRRPTFFSEGDCIFFQQKAPWWASKNYF